MFPRRDLGLARCDKMSKQQSLFRFLGGKRPLSESADEKTKKRREQKKKTYEDCRDRKFLPQWLETFPWLTYKKDSGLMFCKVRCFLIGFVFIILFLCFVLVWFVCVCVWGGGGCCFGAS